MTDDPAALRQQLDDPDEDVRAQAAYRLAEIGDPYALDALIRTLDDGAGPNHVDITPSVSALGAMGDRALPALLEPLSADDELTRLHAQRALEAVEHHGSRLELGEVGYAYDAAPGEREAAVDRLRTVLEEPS
jgi:HEAT repeat protein